MNHLPWQGVPPDSHVSTWHWLRPRGWKLPMPFYWHAAQACWQIQDKWVCADQVGHTHEYVEPVTWASVYDVSTNSWKIL